jgi:hypothetical protein
MKKYLLAALLMTGTGMAWANPCDADVEKYCGDIQPGMGALGNCMQSQSQNFTAQCREWMQKTDAALRKLAGACSFDAREYCRDVKPGYGRLRSCLVANSDKISSACKEAVQ